MSNCKRKIHIFIIIREQLNKIELYYAVSVKKKIQNAICICLPILLFLLVELRIREILTGMDLSHRSVPSNATRGSRLRSIRKFASSAAFCFRVIHYLLGFTVFISHIGRYLRIKIRTFTRDFAGSIFYCSFLLQ